MFPKNDFCLRTISTNLSVGTYPNCASWKNKKFIKVTIEKRNIKQSQGLPTDMSKKDKKNKHDNDTTIADWHGYYRGVFGPEDDLFFGVRNDFYKEYFNVVNYTASDYSILEAFIIKSDMDNCILLPLKAENGHFKIQVMHCLFKRDHNKKWKPSKFLTGQIESGNMLIGSDNLEFEGPWKMFDPLSVWGGLNYLNPSFHNIAGLQIPFLFHFLRVDDIEEFSALDNYLSDAEYADLVMHKIPNGFVFIPSLLEHFGITTGTDCNELGFYIAIYLKKVIEDRKKTNQTICLFLSLLSSIYTNF